MAVTVLQHMKEAPKYKPQHLQNAIKYILDVRNDGAKTDFGKWVGGNVGLEFNEIFWNFMNTKKVLEKLDGRQGYHFVISFNKEENVSAETCFNVLEDFCKNYLGDEYDYVFAVHTDKEHMHGHIIFNSVNRITAKKYRYEKGDWEKYIQPVTDQIAQTYNLLPLTYEKERIGVSHAKWAEKNLRKLNWKTIIRADVDYAIKNSSTWEEFLQNMKAMNYALDLRGYSTKHESNYITFCYKGDDGKIHKKRSYTLTSGESDDYSVQNIVRKIKSKTLDEPYYEVISDVMKNNVNMRLGQLSSSVKNTKTYYRMYQAVNYYKLPNPYAESKHTVRKDMLRIEKLIEECMYLKKNPSLTFDKLDKRLQIVEDELKKAYIERKSLREFDKDIRDEVSKYQIDRYRQLKKELSKHSEFNDRWEELEDELEKLEKELPSILIEREKKLIKCESKIAILKKEKSILGRVIQTEGGNGETLQKDIKEKPEIKI